MRTLSFKPLDPRFERIYAACVHLSEKRPRDRKDQKLNNAILDKLGAIGQLVPALDEKGMEREHRHGELKFYETMLGGDVRLENTEYEMVVEHMVSAIPNVHRQFGPEHEDALTWLEGLAKDDEVPAESKA